MSHLMGAVRLVLLTKLDVGPKNSLKDSKTSSAVLIKSLSSAHSCFTDCLEAFDFLALIAFEIFDSRFENFKDLSIVFFHMEPPSFGTWWSSLGSESINSMTKNFYLSLRNQVNQN